MNSSITTELLLNSLLDNLPFEPTTDQQKFLQTFTKFIISEQHQPVMIMRGYAGTGKTTMLKCIIPVLQAFNINSVLLAPTGRAAKVMSNYTKSAASTIHRHIYKVYNTQTGSQRVVINKNENDTTLYLVDESSMIATGTNEYGNNLLEDLLRYVYNGTKNRILFLGDNAQLPPVGETLSGALQPQYIEQVFSSTIYRALLTQVMRQHELSGVLYNATKLRVGIQDTTIKPNVKFELAGYDDIVKLDGADLLNYLEQAYQSAGVEDTIIVCRTNKRANIFNESIRARIFNYDAQLCIGDYLMITKNNYYWIKNIDEIQFLANGDTVRVKQILGYIDLYGYSFCKVVVTPIDYNENIELQVIVMLSTLLMESPALTYEQQKLFFDEVMLDYADEKTKAKRVALTKENEFYNALQIKYSYAVTCHKSQGGQWSEVFIDQGYLTDEMVNADFLKWLYTALTRSKSKVYLINFNSQFFQLE